MAFNNDQSPYCIVCLESPQHDKFNIMQMRKLAAQLMLKKNQQKTNMLHSNKRQPLKEDPDL